MMNVDSLSLAQQRLPTLQTFIIALNALQPTQTVQVHGFESHSLPIMIVANWVHATFLPQKTKQLITSSHRHVMSPLLITITPTFYSFFWNQRYSQQTIIANPRLPTLRVHGTNESIRGFLLIPHLDVFKKPCLNLFVSHVDSLLTIRDRHQQNQLLCSKKPNQQFTSVCTVTGAFSCGVPIFV